MKPALCFRIFGVALLLGLAGTGCTSTTAPSSAQRADLLPTAVEVDTPAIAGQPEPLVATNAAVVVPAATAAGDKNTATSVPAASAAQAPPTKPEPAPTPVVAPRKDAEAGPGAGAMNAALRSMTNDVASAYRIVPGDELDVEVLREPDISRVFTVGVDGRIKHPLLGPVNAAGLSAAEFERQLTERLGRDFLVDPKIYVRLKHSAAQRVMVFGEVRNPGIYDIGHDEEFSLLRVLARAGGFTEIADIDKVRIVRAGADEDRSMRVRVSDILSGRGNAKDIPLESGDVINVPETLF